MTVHNNTENEAGPAAEAPEIPLPLSLDESTSPFVQEGVARKNLQEAKISYLDGSQQSFYVHKNADAEVLFNMVVAQLNLIEKDYFALSFYNELNIRLWLYKEKKIAKQLKGRPWEFELIVKFYPPEPDQLVEDFTRHLMVLQLRHDVYTERLPFVFEKLALLGSYVAQSELGDYQPHEQYDDYLRGAKIAPIITDELIRRVRDLHRDIQKGQTKSEAEFKYLEACAKGHHLYGVWRFDAKDSKGNPVQVGVSAHGIGIYNGDTGNPRLHMFAWQDIIKIAYRRNAFSIKLKEGVMDAKKEVNVNYRLADYPASKRLWKCGVEHHTFFRLVQAEPDIKPKHGLFRWGSSRFRYSGRTQLQTRMASNSYANSPGSTMQRTESGRVISKSVDDIAQKQHASPLRFADDPTQSKDLISSPEKSYPVSEIESDKKKKKKKDKRKAEDEVGLASSSKSPPPSHSLLLHESPVKAGEYYIATPPSHATDTYYSSSLYSASSQTNNIDSSFSSPYSSSHVTNGTYSSPASTSVREARVHFSDDTPTTTKTTTVKKVRRNLFGRLSPSKGHQDTLIVLKNGDATPSTTPTTDLEKDHDIENVPLDEAVTVYDKGVYVSPKPKTSARLFLKKQRKRVPTSARILKSANTNLQSSELTEVQDLPKQEEIQHLPIRYFSSIYHSGHPQEHISWNKRVHLFNTLRSDEDYVEKNHLLATNYAFASEPCYEHERLELVPEIEALPLRQFVKKYHYGKIEKIPDISRSFIRFSKRRRGSVESVSETEEDEVSPKKKGRARVFLRSPTPKTEEEASTSQKSGYGWIRRHRREPEKLANEEPVVPQAEYLKSEPYVGPLESLAKSPILDTIPLRSTVSPYHSGYSYTIHRRYKIFERIKDETIEEIEETTTIQVDTSPYQGSYEPISKVQELEHLPIREFSRIYHSGKRSKYPKKIRISKLSKTAEEASTSESEGSDDETSPKMSKISFLRSKKAQRQRPTSPEDQDTSFGDRFMNFIRTSWRSDSAYESQPSPSTSPTHPGDTGRLEAIQKAEELEMHSIERVETQTSSEAKPARSEAKNEAKPAGNQLLLCLKHPKDEEKVEESFSPVVASYHLDTSKYEGELNDLSREAELEPLRLEERCIPAKEYYAKKTVLPFNFFKKAQAEPKTQAEATQEQESSAENEPGKRGAKIFTRTKQTVVYTTHPLGEAYDGDLSSMRAADELESSPLENFVEKSKIEPVSKESVEVEFVKDIEEEGPVVVPYNFDTQAYEGPLEEISKATELDTQRLEDFAARPVETTKEEEKESPIKEKDRFGFLKKITIFRKTEVSTVETSEAQDESKTTEVAGEPVAKTPTEEAPEKKKSAKIFVKSKKIPEIVVEEGPVVVTYALNKEPYEGPLEDLIKDNEMESEKLEDFVAKPAEYTVNESPSKKKHRFGFLEKLTRRSTTQKSDIEAESEAASDAQTAKIDYGFNKEAYEGPLENISYTTDLPKTDLEAKPAQETSYQKKSAKIVTKQKKEVERSIVVVKPDSESYNFNKERYEGPLEDLPKSTEIEESQLVARPAEVQYPEIESPSKENHRFGFLQKITHLGKTSEKSKNLEKEETSAPESPEKKKTAHIFTKHHKNETHPLTEAYQGDVENLAPTNELEPSQLENRPSTISYIPKISITEVDQPTISISEVTQEQKSVVSYELNKEPYDGPLEDLTKTSEVEAQKLEDFVARPAKFESPSKEKHHFGFLEKITHLGKSSEKKHSITNEQAEPQPEEKASVSSYQLNKEPFAGPLEDLTKTNEIEPQKLEDFVSKPVEFERSSKEKHHFGFLEKITHLGKSSEKRHSITNEQAEPQPEEKTSVSSYQLNKELYDGPLEDLTKTSEVEAQKLEDFVVRPAEFERSSKEKHHFGFLEKITHLGKSSEKKHSITNEQVEPQPEEKASISSYQLNKDPYIGPLENLTKTNEIEPQKLEDFVSKPVEFERSSKEKHHFGFLEKITHLGKSSEKKHSITNEQAEPQPEEKASVSFYQLNKEPYDGPLEDLTKTSEIEPQKLEDFVSKPVEFEHSSKEKRRFGFLEKITHFGKASEKRHSITNEQAEPQPEEKASGSSYQLNKEPFAGPLEDLTKTSEVEAQKLEDFVVRPAEFESSSKEKHHVGFLEKIKHLGKATKETSETQEKKETAHHKHETHPLGEAYEGELENLIPEKEMLPSPLEKTVVEIVEKAGTPISEVKEKRSSIFKEKRPSIVSYHFEKTVYDGPLESLSKVEEIEVLPIGDHVEKVPSLKKKNQILAFVKRVKHDAPQEPSEEQRAENREKKKKARIYLKSKQVEEKYDAYPKSEPYEGELENVNRAEEMEAVPLESYVALVSLDEEKQEEKPLELEKYPKSEPYEGALSSLGPEGDLQGENISEFCEIKHPGYYEPVEKLDEVSQKNAKTKQKEAKPRKIFKWFKKGHLETTSDFEPKMVHQVPEIIIDSDVPLTEMIPQEELEKLPLEDFVEKPQELIKTASTVKEEPKKEDTIPTGKTSLRVYLRRRSKSHDEDATPTTPTRTPTSTTPSKLFTCIEKNQEIETQEKSSTDLQDYPPKSEPYTGDLFNVGKVAELENQPLKSFVAVYHSGVSEPVISRTFKSLHIFKKKRAEEDQSDNDSYPKITKIPYTGHLDTVYRNDELENLPIKEAVAVYHPGYSTEKHVRNYALLRKIKKVGSPEEEDSKIKLKTIPQVEPTSDLPVDLEKSSDLEAIPLREAVSVYHSGVTTPYQKVHREKYVGTEETGDVDPNMYPYGFKLTYEAYNLESMSPKNELENLPIKQFSQVYWQQREKSRLFPRIFKKQDQSEEPESSQLQPKDEEKSSFSKKIARIHLKRRHRDLSENGELQVEGPREAQESFVSYVTPVKQPEKLKEAKITHEKYNLSAEAYEGPLDDLQKATEIDAVLLTEFCATPKEYQISKPSLKLDSPKKQSPKIDEVEKIVTSDENEPNVSEEPKKTAILHLKSSQNEAKEEPQKSTEFRKSISEFLRTSFNKQSEPKTKCNILDYPQISEPFTGPTIDTSPAAEISHQPLQSAVGVYHSGYSSTTKNENLHIKHEGAEEVQDHANPEDYGPLKLPFDGPIDEISPREELEPLALRQVSNVYYEPPVVKRRTLRSFMHISRGHDEEESDAEEVQQEEILRNGHPSTSEGLQVVQEPDEEKVGLYQSGKAWIERVLQRKHEDLQKATYKLDTLPYEGPLENLTPDGELDTSPIKEHVDLVVPPVDEEAEGLNKIYRSLLIRVKTPRNQSSRHEEATTSFDPTPYEGPLEDLTPKSELIAAPLKEHAEVYHLGQQEKESESLVARYRHLLRAKKAKSPKNQEEIIESPDLTAYKVDAQAYEGPLENLAREIDLDTAPLHEHVEHLSLQKAGKAPEPLFSRYRRLLARTRATSHPDDYISPEPPSNIKTKKKARLHLKRHSVETATKVEEVVNLDTYPKTEPYQGPLLELLKHPEIEAQPLRSIVTVYHSGFTDYRSFYYYIHNRFALFNREKFYGEEEISKENVESKKLEEAHEGPLEELSRADDLEQQALKQFSEVYHSGKSAQKLKKGKKNGIFGRKVSISSVSTESSTVDEKVKPKQEVIIKKEKDEDNVEVKLTTCLPVKSTEYELSKEVYGGPLEEVSYIQDLPKSELEAKPTQEVINETGRQKSFILKLRRSAQKSEAPEVQETAPEAQPAKIDYGYNKEAFEGPLETITYNSDLLQTNLEAKPIQETMPEPSSLKSYLLKLRRSSQKQNVPDAQATSNDYSFSKEVFDGPLETISYNSDLLQTNLEAKPTQEVMKTETSHRKGFILKLHRSAQKSEAPEAQETAPEAQETAPEAQTAKIDYGYNKEAFEGPLETIAYNSDLLQTNLEAKPTQETMPVPSPLRSYILKLRRSPQKQDVPEAQATSNDYGFSKEVYDGPLESTTYIPDLQNSELEAKPTQEKMPEPSPLRSYLLKLRRSPQKQDVPEAQATSNDYSFSKEAFEGPLETIAYNSDLLQINLEAKPTQETMPEPSPLRSYILKLRRSPQKQDVPEAQATSNDYGFSKEVYDGPLESTTYTPDLQNSELEAKPTQEKMPEPSPLRSYLLKLRRSPQKQDVPEAQATSNDYSFSKEAFEGPLETISYNSDLLQTNLEAKPTQETMPEGPNPLKSYILKLRRSPQKQDIPEAQATSNDYGFSKEIYDGPLESTTYTPDLQNSELEAKPDQETMPDVATSPLRNILKIRRSTRESIDQQKSVDYDFKKEVYDGPLETVPKQEELELTPLDLSPRQEPIGTPEKDYKNLEMFHMKIKERKVSTTKHETYPVHEEPYEGPLETIAKSDEFEPTPLDLPPKQEVAESEASIPEKNFKKLDMFHMKIKERRISTEKHETYPVHEEPYEGPLETIVKSDEFEPTPLDLPPRQEVVESETPTSEKDFKKLGMFHMKIKERSVSTEKHEAYPIHEEPYEGPLEKIARSDELETREIPVDAPIPNLHQEVIETPKRTGILHLKSKTRPVPHETYPTLTEAYDGPLVEVAYVNDLEATPLEIPPVKEVEKSEDRQGYKKFGLFHLKAKKHSKSSGYPPQQEPYEGPLETVSCAEELAITPFEAKPEEIQLDENSGSAKIEPEHEEWGKVDYHFDTQAYEGPLETIVYANDLPEAPLEARPKIEATSPKSKKTAILYLKSPKKSENEPISQNLEEITPTQDTDENQPVLACELTAKPKAVKREKISKASKKTRPTSYPINPYIQWNVYNGPLEATTYTEDIPSVPLEARPSLPENLHIEQESKLAGYWKRFSPKKTTDLSQYPTKEDTYEGPLEAIKVEDEMTLAPLEARPRPIIAKDSVRVAKSKKKAILHLKSPKKVSEEAPGKPVSILSTIRREDRDFNVIKTVSIDQEIFAAPQKPVTDIVIDISLQKERRIDYECDVFLAIKNSKFSPPSTLRNKQKRPISCEFLPPSLLEDLAPSAVELKLHAPENGPDQAEEPEEEEEDPSPAKKPHVSFGTTASTSFEATSPEKLNTTTSSSYSSTMDGPSEDEKKQAGFFETMRRRLSQVGWLIRIFVH
uniref:FERM domain-containing protein n=1 Tax=Acrobeloides nanus TaxID=290746 RepID=A0A914DKV8_9BILA